MIFSEPICPSYSNLIEGCWSSNVEDRHTFSEIVTELKTNPNFITESINKEEYLKYIQDLNEAQVSFYPSKKKKIILMESKYKDRLSEFKDIETKIIF